MTHQYGRTPLDAIGELMSEVESLKAQIAEDWRERAKADAILEQSCRLMGCADGTLADRIQANGRYWAELVRRDERDQAAKAMEPTLTLEDEPLTEAIVEYGRRRAEEAARAQFQAAASLRQRLEDETTRADDNARCYDALKARLDSGTAGLLTGVELIASLEAQLAQAQQELMSLKTDLYHAEGERSQAEAALEEMQKQWADFEEWLIASSKYPGPEERQRGFGFAATELQRRRSPRGQEEKSMSKFSDYEVTEAMIRHGGSFVQGLGRLYRLADAQNQATLRSAFAGYFEEYQALALRADIERAGEWLASGKMGD